MAQRDDIPIPLVARRDLFAFPCAMGYQTTWCIKDPLSLRYFHLTEEEYFLLSRLDGRGNLKSLRRDFEEKFAPRRVRGDTLLSLAARFRAEGLAIASEQGQSALLWEERRSLYWQKMAHSFARLLAIRLFRIRPRGLLDGAAHVLGWLFTGPGFAVATLLVIMALALLLADGHRWIGEVTGAAYGSSWLTLTGLLAAIAVLRTWHELGHAVACRHFGGQCHEMGIMLLFFAPCLYCDVSDSWTFPSRVRRIAVAAAGVYFELLAAAAAAIAWFLIRPGSLASTACVYATVAGGISTLLINGNPLVRLDGYYVLSDLVGRPNLMPRAWAILTSDLFRLLFGSRPGADPLGLDTPRWAYLVFAALSMTYRAVVVALLIWAIHRFLGGYHLSAVAWIVTAAIIAPWLLSAGVQTGKSLRSIAARGELNVARASLGVMTLATMAAVGLVVPLPHWCTATAKVEPRGARRVYAAHSGTLHPLVAPGDRVQRGQLLAEIHNDELELEVTRREADVRRLQRLMDSLESRRGKEDVSAALALVRAQLADAREQRDEKVRQRQLLRLSAPTDGVVYSFATHRWQPLERDVLPSWSGPPLAPWNRGCYVQPGDVVCTVGPSDAMELDLEIRQDDVALVEPGQRVSIELDQFPFAMLTGTIESVARMTTRKEASSRRDPRARNAVGWRTAQPDAVEVVYLAKAGISDARHVALLPGGRGTARIRVRSMSLWEHFRRGLRPLD